MKKTYVKNQSFRRRKPKPAQNAERSRLPEWAGSLFASSSDLATSSILSSVRKLSRDEKSALKRHIATVLRERTMKRDAALRNGAARLVVALLPQTFDILEHLLSDCSSFLWYEVQFTVFSALDREDLSGEDQRRVLALIEHYLANVKSQSGYAAWKAGDLLGDEWNTSETVQILERLLCSAKNVAGRKAALHGIEHAIKKATRPERDRLFSKVRRAAAVDPSADVRRNAALALQGVGCHRLSFQD